MEPQARETGPTTANRRSRRIHFAIPVVIRATVASQLIEEPAKTLQVNAHGCSVYMTAQVELGQRALLINPATREKEECTVNFVGKKENNQMEVGLEFVESSPLFWHIHFPPEDWNPEDRKLPTNMKPLPGPPRRR